MSVDVWILATSDELPNVVDLSSNFYHLPSMDMNENSEGVMYTFAVAHQVSYSIID
jgi:hypothetical protein